MEMQVTPLRVALKRLRLQQKQVADGIEVSVFTVSNWVHGRSTPTGRNLLRLADYLRQFDPAVTPESIMDNPGAAA